MLLARTDAHTLSSPGLYVLAGVALIVVSLFLRFIVLVADAGDSGRRGWPVSRRGWLRFQLWLGVLMVVGGLIAVAVTGRFFVG